MGRLSSIKKRACVALACTGILAAVGGCSDDEAPIPARADSGFDMATNAFAFENFADGYSESRMKPELMVRMFGAEASCVDPAAVPCSLLPAARTWMSRVNAAMDGGRCEGFVVLSGLLYYGAVDATPLGAESARKLSLDGNLLLQEELAYWFATQNVPAVLMGKTRKLNARDALRFMATFLKPDATEFYRIGFVRKTKKGITGGHAVTPMRYAETDRKGVYELHVYDNNFPDQDRVITIDANANRWEYRGSTNPDEAGALYVGDEQNGNPLYFSPVKARVGKLPAPFAKDAAESQTIFQGALQVEARSGKSSAGIDANGAPVESGDGKLVPSFSALATWDNSAPVTLLLPPGETTFDVRGAEGDSGLRPPQVHHTANGMSVTAENLVVTPGFTDTLKVNAEGATYTNTSGTALTLTTGSGPLLVTVTLAGPSRNVVSSVDPATGGIVLVTDGTANGLVEVAVTRADTGGADTLTLTGADTSRITLDASTLKPGTRLTGTQDTGSGPVAIGDACANGKQDVGEDGIDCGGSCAFACPAAPPTCSDGAKNGAESDVDCGGTCATKCANGLVCASDPDCASAYCEVGTCASRDRLVFLSSAAWTGNLGGLAGADAKCQALADAAQKRGTYKAFLSSIASSAAARLGRGAARYVLVDGTVVATDAASFFSVFHLAPIDLTETGARVNARVFTASRGTGDYPAESPTCSDWTGDIGQPRNGSSNVADDGWADNELPAFCSDSLHLYCVQQ